MDGDIKITQEPEYFHNLMEERSIMMEIDIPYLDTNINNDIKLEADCIFGQSDIVKAEMLEYYCDFCASTFANEYDLLKHNLRHLKVQIIKKQFFQCDTCQIYFISRQHLIEHLAKHGNTKITDSYVKCRLCKKIYKYKSWMSHVKEVHGTGCYQCEICNEYFKCKRYLVKHEKKHVLEFKFNNKELLYDQDPERYREIFYCPKCPKSFYTHSSLAVHLKSVHTNGEFHCDLCPSHFKCMQYLRVHKRRVHYNDGKQHICAICGKGFRSPRYMNVHIKNSHFKTEFHTENNVQLVGGDDVVVNAHEIGFSNEIACNIEIGLSE